jgi:hypothetical protein
VYSVVTRGGAPTHLRFFTIRCDAGEHRRTQRILKGLKLAKTQGGDPGARTLRWPIGQVWNLQTKEIRSRLLASARPHVDRTALQGPELSCRHWRRGTQPAPIILPLLMHCAQDSVTGLLLAGIGHITQDQKKNFLIVDSSIIPLSHLTNPLSLTSTYWRN